MAEKRARVQYDGEGLRFAALTGSGHQLVTDDSAGDAGPRPVELLLVALAGCAAMDVISILHKKRQEPASYEVAVRGVQRDEHPHLFEQIEVTHLVSGAIDPSALRRAIELSATRYCSVGAGLASGAARLTPRFVIRTDVGEEISGEVAVRGPHATIDEPAGVAG